MAVSEHPLMPVMLVIVLRNDMPEQCVPGRWVHRSGVPVASDREIFIVTSRHQNTAARFRPDPLFEASRWDNDDGRGQRLQHQRITGGLDMHLTLHSRTVLSAVLTEVVKGPLFAKLRVVGYRQVVPRLTVKQVARR